MITTGLFVTGVDTGIGKTTITGALALTLIKNGYDVGVMKPVESGAKTEQGKDTKYLKKMTGTDDPENLVAPYVLKKPLSPYHAALAEDLVIDPEKIRAAYKHLSTSHDITLVEGAGGPLAPLTDKLDIGDLARLMGVPALIVAHPFLGSINHTLSTIQAVRTQGVNVLGVIFSQHKKKVYPVPDFDFIEKRGGVPVFGLVQHISDPDNPDELLENFLKGVDVDRLITALETGYSSSRRNYYEERDKKYIWHPFTQMKQWRKDRVTVIESGHGVKVRDVTGDQFLDGFSSYWCNIHGHGEPRLIHAAHAQLGKIAHSTFLGLSNVPAIELAERLIEIAPEGMKKVFYSDNGSTAVEVGLKMAYQYWKRVEPESNRTKFLALDMAYHGDTVGAMAVGGVDLYHAEFRDILFATDFVPAPYCYRCPLGKSYPDCAIACADVVGEKLTANKDRYAAMIVEPLVQCPGGIITAPHGYLKKIAEILRRHNTLLIADEVAVGFGRTGEMFACNHEEVTPDIMALSKSITGGILPFAATLTTDMIYNAFDGEHKDGKTFFHGHTYTANQVGAAVALENLKLYKERNIVATFQERGADLSSALVRFVDLHHVGDIRQRGLIAGIELVQDRLTKEPFDSADRTGHKVCEEAKRRGLLVRPLGDVLVLFPAPVVTESELNRMTDILHQSIVAITGN